MEIEKQFCSIPEASLITGLSRKFIRRNLDSIPHAVVGRKSFVYMDGLKEFALNTGKGKAKDNAKRKVSSTNNKRNGDNDDGKQRKADDKDTGTEPIPERT